MLFVVVLFWVGRVLASPELRPRAAPRLLTLAAALVVGAALAAVALIPFAELLRHSSDATARADASALLKQPSRYLLAIFLPDYWGSRPHGSAAGRRSRGARVLRRRAAADAGRRGARAAPSAARIAVAAVGAVTLAVATGVPPSMTSSSSCRASRPPTTAASR